MLSILLQIVVVSSFAQEGFCCIEGACVYEECESPYPTFFSCINSCQPVESTEEEPAEDEQHSAAVEDITILNEEPFAVPESATLCGNGIREEGEQCDTGPANSDTRSNACRTSCTLPTCGDRVLDESEECDEGEGNSDSIPNRCRTDCSMPTCGDGVVDVAELCDDGNRENGDGCDSSCNPERAVFEKMSPPPPSAPTVQPLPTAAVPLLPQRLELPTPRTLNNTGPAAAMAVAIGGAVGWVAARRRK